VVWYHIHRYQETDSVEDRPRSGRPAVTTERDDRVICAAARENPFFHTARLQRRLAEATGRVFSVRTVRNRLYEDGRSAFRPLKFPKLTARHRVNRLAWATNHVTWTRRQWSSVMFSDESKFNITRADGRLRVWRKRGEDLRTSANAVLETDAFGLGGVMVWGGIWQGGRTPLVIIRGGRLNARRYIDEILEPVAIPAGNRAIGERRFRLQQDGATAHTAIIVRDFLQERNVQLLDWSAKMPDMSPIEHVWDMLGVRLYDRDAQPPQDYEDLARKLDEIWNAIPQDDINNLILSMNRRCQALVRTRGGATDY